MSTIHLIGCLQLLLFEKFDNNMERNYKFTKFSESNRCWKQVTVAPNGTNNGSISTFPTRPGKVDLSKYVEEGQEWSVGAVQRTQVLLRLCGNDSETEQIVSTMLTTEVGRLLSLEGDGLVASEAILSSLAIMVSCLHQGMTSRFNHLVRNFALTTPLYHPDGVRVEVNVEAVMAWVERSRRKASGESFLYDRDVTSAPQTAVSFVATVAALLSELLKSPTAAGSLKPESWDAILCSLRCELGNVG